MIVRDAELVGVMLPILEPTGAQSAVWQVVRTAVPEVEKDVLGKKAGGGGEIVRDDGGVGLSMDNVLLSVALRVVVIESVLDPAATV